MGVSDNPAKIARIPEAVEVVVEVEVIPRGEAAIRDAVVEDEVEVHLRLTHLSQDQNFATFVARITLGIVCCAIIPTPI